MTLLKGRRPTIEAAHDWIESEARRLGLRVVRVVGHRAPDGGVEFSAALGNGAECRGASAPGAVPIPTLGAGCEVGGGGP